MPHNFAQPADDREDYGRDPVPVKLMEFQGSQFYYRRCLGPEEGLCFGSRLEKDTDRDLSRRLESLLAPNQGRNHEELCSREEDKVRPNAILPSAEEDRTQGLINFDILVMLASCFLPWANSVTEIILFEHIGRNIAPSFPPTQPCNRITASQTSSRSNSQSGRRSSAHPILLQDKNRTVSWIGKHCGAKRLK
jgi:hypothetical protein